MELDQDFREFIESFATHDVRFLIIGGYAMAAHGHPRYTKDLDVWVRVDPDNASRILAALEDFGFGSLGLTAEDFLDTDVVVQLGHEPKRIDILTFATGLQFDDSYLRRVTMTFDGIDVAVVGIDDLRVNKLATGRLRDLADVDDLPPDPDR